MPKITPESFKRETGLKNSELKNLVGVIAGAEKGGVTIEQAAESILENYGDELRGLGFTGDVQEVRNVIIDILSGGNPRSYAKRGLEQRKQQSIDEQRAEMEDVAVQLGFKDIEEWIAYEESFLPSKLEKYKDFDENEYFNNLAENNEDDTTRESENFGRGSEILQNEQSADNSGERTVDERNEGTTVSNNVQGGDTNGTPQGNQPKVSSSEILSTGDTTSPVETEVLTNNVKTEDVNQSEDNLEMGESTTISQESEQVSDKDNAPYTIAPAQYTTKKGKVLDMFLVKIPTELNSKQSRVANSLVRGEYKGWWDKEQGGFMLRSEDDAIRFGEYLADLVSQEPVELVSMDDIKAVNDGDVVFTEPKQEDSRIWQYSIHIDADGYTTLSRDDVSGIYPIGDARFRQSTNSPEEMLDILRNPLNGMQEALEAVGVTLENKIKTRNIEREAKEKRRREYEALRENGVNGYKIGEKVIYTPASGTREPIEATIHDFEEFGAHNPVLDVGMAPVIYELAQWSDISKVGATVKPQKVNVENLFGELNKKGEAKLSDHVEQPTNPSGNRLVTDQRYAELRERMRKKLGGQMNIGIDPEILAIGTEMAVYHLEKGARKFTEYAKVMIADLGDAIRPYLKAFYNGARNLPEVESSEIATDMTPYDEVQTFDVANFDKPGIDVFATAETVTREAEVAQEVEVAQERIKKVRKTKNDNKNSINSQQEQLNLFDNGREENTAADNSGTQLGRKELPNTEQVGAGVSVQDTARDSKRKRRNAGVRSSESGNGPQYDVNRNYTNEEIETIVSSVTDIVDGKVVITGEVTDDIKAIARGYESGGIAKKGRGILDEYYTDGKIVDAVNMLIAPYFSSSTPIRVLEPSIGIGNFIQAVNNIPTSEVVAFEINETTARIAKILYPDVDVNLRSFETEFIDESGNKKPLSQKYSLVIGNPPYGSHRGLYKGLGEESKIARYEDYFVKRSLDVLDEGGVLAMVLPSSWIDRHTKFGGYTIERAYRLPSGAFEATQVGTDIVILRKDSSVPVTEHVPYFEQFPERVLGEIKERTGRYGRTEEFVEGDIDAAIEAIKKENAEQLADLLDIEKSNDALNNIESAIDETGSTEKAVGVVKDAQNSEKADNKPATKLSGKQDKYKVELNRGAETVPTSSQFTHEFSEGEVEAFADTDYEGTLSNPTKHKRYANYIGGSAVHDFYYAEGDIYSKLALLEQDKRYIVENYGAEQYEKQKALLEGVLPKQKSLDEITISPNTAFVKNLNILTDGERVSLKDMFVDFCRKLPYQAFGSSSAWEVIGYVNNEQVHGTDKQRNQLVRERRKRAANDLFNKFLNEELSDNAKKQVVAAFNREYNSTYRPDYSKVPMFSTINRDFKGKPLKLTSVQLAGIGRMTVKGVGVLAHEVGFGKTLSGILAMHEAMTRGFAKKPLIVVPNDNILKQWVETIGEVLPSATVNTLGNLGAGYDLTDFMVNDGEFTIITYEGLKAMSFSDRTYNHLASKFSYITEDLNKHQSERDIQKNIEKKNELKGKMKRGTKASYMFENFGFDWLTVDEVHNANHIVSKVRLDKSVASDFRSQSQRTSDLGLKTWLAAQYIQEENNGRNVLLLSATPFTNKPLEYYSVLSLVGNDMLERKGFFNVDQFFATFMEADNELEIGANGRPVQKTNVRRFRNNGLFQQLLSEFIDIKGEEDNPELVRPERLNKEYKIAQNELTTEAMAAAQELLSDNDTVLQGIGHARAAAFSPYATSLLGMQPKNHKEFVKNSPKIDATIKMIEQNIKDRPDAGQIIYSEVGVEYFPLIRDYLVKESGLKPSEVRIITGATSNNERVNIQSAFNNGEVKVVVGSPAIKEGLNLQGNTTDMYILSLPWNFTQLRQIEGRGWRQGNKWENIRINYMLTNDSVDVFMLQRLQLKQGLYNEAMKSGAESLDVSDIDTAELKTALITDPAVRAEIVTVQERAKLQQEKTQIEADLSFVMRKYEAYNKLVSKLESQKNTIKMYREWAKKGDEYWAQRVEREEAQLTSIENEIEEEKQNLIKKGVNVDDIVRQTQQSQNDIAAIQEKIDNLKEFQEELTQKFREESEAKAKEQGDLVSTYIKERKAENKGGFYKIRPVKSENKAVEEDDDTLYREDDEISYDEAVLIAEEFVGTHKGAAKKVVISKGYEFVEQQMRNAGFSEVSIEAFKKNYAKGKRTTAAYYPDSDGIVIFKTGDKSSFMDSIWHENSHRVLDKYIKNPGLLKIRFDELPVKYKDIIIKLLEGNYEEYQYPQEAMCMFIGGLYKNTPYLKNGKYNITRDFITFEKEYRRFVDFAQNVIDNIYYGRETEFDGDGPSGINGRQGEWNSTHQRNSGRERDGGTNKERTEVVNREGEGSIADREVVMDSDPYSKALGRPRYTGKKMGEYVARQRMEMAKRVKALAQKLNLNIDVLESTEGLSGKRAKAKGWYEPKGKRIVVVIPNHTSVNDAVATVLHEAVAHHGLRELFGENFDTFLQNVYNNADADVREAIETLAAQRYNGNLLTATEEHLASLAENTDFEYATKSGWWERIKDYFFKMLRGLGIEGFSGITLTDNELRYILWRSYQNLANPGMYNNVFGRVKDTAKQYELKVGDYAPAVQNGSMVAGEDIDNSYTELSYEEAQGTATADDTRFRIEENSIDNVPTQPLTFTEKITNSVLEASARNKENLTQRSEALRAYGSNLANVLKLMQAQRVYDKSTVDTLMKMAKMYFKNAQLLGHITPCEAGRIMSVLHGAVGKRDVTNDANKLVGILVDAHSKELQGLLDKAAKTKAKKVNASGVEVMGSLDKMGQIALEAYNEAVDLDEKAIEDKLYEAQNDTAHPEEAEARINGLMMAREYVTDIKQKKQEIKDLQALLKEKAKDAREGNMSRRAWKEFRKDTEEAIMEDKLGVIDAYHSLIYRMSTDISKASARAKAFQKSVIDHTREIQHFANSDMQGRSASAQGELPTKYNNAVLRGLMSGAPTFQYMLKKFGEKDVDGKGYLYDYFMGAVTKAKDKEFNGKLGNTLLMEAKLEELFGKKMKIADLYKYMRADGTTLSYREGGEMREMEISQGQMLYIYMLNKMADGRMKLSGMGITGDVVAKMAEELPKELVAFADWVQDDFLTKLREKYNIVHERMFGAPMAAIENYFPIKVNKRSIGSKEDISKDIENDKLSTMTGAIIKRKKNAAPIDLSVDALSALLDHINEMEHWAAFAEFNRDVNTLVNYNHFKNQVMNMSSFRYGSGKTLWENFRKTAQVVSGTYRPEQNTIDKAVLNISKGVTASKIAFRGYTAVKQVLSAPAFWSEASVDNLLFCYVNPKGSCEWAMEFLPGFKERWMGRMMGNEKLLPQDSDWKIWRNNFVKNATRIGMTPNAAVDALTVAQGARAVYLTKLEAYKKAGYTEQRANEKALQAAAEAYNESQQSSMGAYISPIQASGTAMTSLLTTFKNANFGYTRKTAQSLANIKRHTEKGYKEEAIAYMTKKFMREGLTEEQAKKLAERRYKRSVYRDSANVALYGFGLNMLWMLGGSAIYLLAGDDDEKKEELVNEALIRGALGSLDGIPLGETLANWATASMMGEDAQLRMPRLIAVNDFENIVQIMKSDRVRGAYELANMFIAMGIGVNPTTFVDAFMAFADVEEWSAEEVAMLALKILNAPKSQLEQLEVDKAMANGGVDATEVMRRYVEQRTRNQAPGLQGLYSDENLQKAWTKNAKRFDRFLDERLENVIEDDFAFRMFYDDADAMTRAKISEMREKYLKGDDKAFVKKELEDVINGVYFGAEKKTVYYGLANEDDLNEDFELKQMIALLSPVYSEYLKMKDGLQKGNFFNEHKDEIVLYKNLNARKSKMDSMKKYMQDNPGLAEKNMREIRKLRTEAMNLISGYNE